VALERLDGIRGTAGIITAGSGKQGPERHLIPTDEQDEELPHHSGVGEADSASIADRQRASWVRARATSAANASNVAP
jgi:hypothetical protein